MPDFSRSAPIVVTGGAGFIGSHLCERLLSAGAHVVAIDNFDPFYPAAVKRQNISGLLRHPAFTLVEADITDLPAVLSALERRGVSSIPVLVHLAAKAGVRPSIEQPVAYARANVEGTTAALELLRRFGGRRFVFGSSSSVYGNNEKVPFAESDPVERPISPYAATKRAGELLCHTYHHLFGITAICLRFFTVYGPRQRPDLAIHKFTRLMAAGEAVPMFGDGSTERDYTYIDDILQGVEAAIAWTDRGTAAFEICNLGESRTTALRTLIELIASALRVSPKIDRQPVQPGDVLRTFASVEHARELLQYRPTTPVEVGIPRFVEWFRSMERTSP